VRATEGSLEPKCPTTWTDEEAEVEKVKRREEERRAEERKGQKKEDAGEKAEKPVKHVVFPMICGSGGSKSRLAKAAGAEPSGQMKDEQFHAVVAPSAFQVQNTPTPEHVWKMRC